MDQEILDNFKRQMAIKLDTTTNNEAEIISNMVDGALSGKGGNDPELESLKKQMVIKLGATTNQDAQIISNMVDNAAGGSGGGGGIAYKSVFGPITDEVQPSGGYYIIENYDADVIANNDVFILEMNLNTPLVLFKGSSGNVLRDSTNKNKIFIEDEAVAIQLDPTYGPYDYPASDIFLYATYFQDNEDDEGGAD